MGEGGFLDKAKDMVGGAAGDVGEMAKRIAEGAAEKIDEATESMGGVAKRAGDAIGSNKETVGNAAADIARKVTSGGGAD